MIDPQLYDFAFPHGLGLLVIRHEPARCPTCARSMKLWLSFPEKLNRLDVCLGCAVRDEQQEDFGNVVPLRLVRTDA